LPTINEHPAVLELVRQLQENTGEPVLVITTIIRPMIMHGESSHTLTPPYSPNERTITERHFTFGLLSTDRLMPNKEDPTKLGIPFVAYSTIQEGAGDGTLCDGPFWFSAAGNRLTVNVGNPITVIVGSRGIATWLSTDEDHLLAQHVKTLYRLAKVLLVNIHRWPEISKIVRRAGFTSKLAVETRREEIQNKLRVALESAMADPALQTLREQYDAAVEYMELFTGQTPPELVEFPQFRAED
jgi:hypothetical protein